MNSHLIRFLLCFFFLVVFSWAANPGQAQASQEITQQPYFTMRLTNGQFDRTPGPIGLDEEQFQAYLTSLSAVSWAEVEQPVSLAVTPNDPRYTTQKPLPQMWLPSAWDETRGVETQTIAIIDTGIDGLHEDLLGRITEGFNFVANQAIAAGASSDDNGHGTLVAGIVGAKTDNGKGISGINWFSQLMPLKVVDKNGESNTTWVANALIYAADHNVRVVNLSLGTSIDTKAIRDAVAYAIGKGVVVVAASGNHQDSDSELNKQVVYPAAYADVIAVGSVNDSDLISSFSNTGAAVDLVAPGETILSTSLSSSHTTYTTASGTSVAAPMVTGIASLLTARFPHLRPTQIQQFLTDQADKPAGMAGNYFSTSYGYGRVNATRAISYHAGFIGQNSHPRLTAGQSYGFEVTVQNIGGATWYRERINLATDRERDRAPRFLREDRVTNQPSGWFRSNRVQLVEPAVGMGQYGTFRFYYTVPNDLPSGVYREYFRPVAEDISFLEDMGLYWDVTVTGLADTYHAAFVGQNSYPILKAGQSYGFEVQLRNTGTTSWEKGKVNLGTDRDRDRVPRFIREDLGGQPSGWLSSNRVSLVQEIVAPGQIGTFRFYATVPTDLPSGTYREYFRPVAEGITWLEDMGIYWEITVTK